MRSAEKARVEGAVLVVEMLFDHSNFNIGERNMRVAAMAEAEGRAVVGRIMVMLIAWGRSLDSYTIRFRSSAVLINPISTRQKGQC